MGTVFAASRYLSWGVLSVSVTNLLVILVMVAVFVVALLAPFPRDDERAHSADESPGPHEGPER